MPEQSMLPMQNEQKAVDDEHVEKPSAQDDDDSTGSLGFGLQRKWEEMFARLVAYKEKHGDCLVPNRYADDPQLGSWGTSPHVAASVLGLLNGLLTPCFSVDAEETV